jgi:hypothetical protein
MSIILHVEPKICPLSWDEFCKNAPPNSIALDGYVHGPPQFNHDGPWCSFNHHENVDRLATRATCGQVLMAIRQGLFSTFQEKPHVFVNDCDEDVCTSVFLLRQNFLSENVSNPALNRLVYMEDALDSTAGCYPFPVKMPILKQLAWVFEPYRKFRLSGELDKKNPESHASIITDVENRIMLHILGNGKEIPIDTRYKIIENGHGWVLIEEIGTHAKTGLFSDGHKAYVSVRTRLDGKYTYTIGKLAFAKFDIPKLINLLNTLEAQLREPVKLNEFWGGGNTIAGSPRVGGSVISPKEITKLINEATG